MSRSRVAINLFAAHKIQTGIGTYLTGLIEGLSKIDLEFEPVLIINKEGKEIFQKHLKYFEYFLAPKITNTIKGRVFYEHTSFVRDLKKLNIDLLHSPVFVSPRNYKGKGVLTIHDTTFITHPQYHIPSKRIYFKWGIPRSVNKNDKVIAISQNTKKDLIKLFPDCKNKFVYIPYGVKKIFFNGLSPKKVKEFNKKYDLPDKYLLYVGVLEPRKNIEGIIKAFLNIHQRIPEYKLLLAGRRGWYDNEIFNLIKEHNLQNKIIHIGHVEYDMLPHLYKKASIFLYPSFYEGFGMPVLEAMASGCPVITSNISSTKEVAKDAAYLVNPNNIDEISKGILKILKDEKFRSKIIERGLKRANEFSWKEVAKKTQKLYLGVING